MTRIITYNVNGIRAALTKDFLGWLKAANPDILCLQEIKATADQIPVLLFEELGYQCFWHPAQKKGYSGTAILTRRKPLKISTISGMSDYDNEGRIIRADYENYSVMSVYMPSGSSGDERQSFKMKFLGEFQSYIATLKSEIPNLIICGDYNICHKAIDIHNPKSNANTSGFLPEEREWIDSFMKSGFIDSFRHFNPEPHNYTWWSYRAGSRGKNLGWRIDYNLVSTSLESNLNRSTILAEAKHSDHCPVLLEIDIL